MEGLVATSEQPPSSELSPSRNSPPTAMTIATAPSAAYETAESGTDTDSASSASDEEYHSFSSSDEENDASTHDRDGKEHEARELERQRVLEAAGLLVVNVRPEHGDADEHEHDAHRTPPPRPPRRRSTRRRRRTPPQTPSTNNAPDAIMLANAHARSNSNARANIDVDTDLRTANRSSIASVSSDRDKELPLPPPTPASVLHVDDAFERYEAYRQSKNWRMSMSSIDTGPPSPGLGPPPASLSATPSRDGRDGGEQRQSQSSHSHIFNFLTRSKTPTHEPERPRLQISAPILSTKQSSEDLSRPGSPSFGSVSLRHECEGHLADGYPTVSHGLAC